MTQWPDLWLLAVEQSRPWEVRLSARGDVYALSHTPPSRTLEYQPGKLTGGKVNAVGFDPHAADGECESQGRRTFDPPGEEQPGEDRMLALELAATTAKPR